MDIAVLKERAKIVSAIRRFFDEQGFVEVETAVRIDAPAPEEHIDCPIVLGATSRGGISPNPSAGRDVSYLRASPELQMKKLLAAGMDRIYQIGPCFREGEKGSRHNPEFTMIEWYRKGATYLDIKNDLRSLVSSLMSSREDFRRETKDARRGFETLAVRDAYLRFAGWDPWKSWDQDRFDFDMATKIEPAIKEIGGGVFLMDYPPQAASLAKISEHPNAPSTKHQAPSTPFAERWEFYWDGMELANCFTELCDRDEQVKRFEAARESRKLLKESDYPIDNEFIDILPQIGSAAGVALGIDRLVMVLTKTKEISAVRADI